MHMNTDTTNNKDHDHKLLPSGSGSADCDCSVTSSRNENTRCNTAAVINSFHRHDDTEDDGSTLFRTLTLPPIVAER